MTSNLYSLCVAKSREQESMIKKALVWCRNISKIAFSMVSIRGVLEWLRYQRYIIYRRLRLSVSQMRWKFRTIWWRFGSVPQSCSSRKNSWTSTGKVGSTGGICVSKKSGWVSWLNMDLIQAIQGDDQGTKINDVSVWLHLSKIFSKIKAAYLFWPLWEPLEIFRVPVTG